MQVMQGEVSCGDDMASRTYQDHLIHHAQLKKLIFEITRTSMRERALRRPTPRTLRTGLEARKEKVVRDYVNHWKLLHDGQGSLQSLVRSSVETAFSLEDLRGYRMDRRLCGPVEHSLYLAPKKKNRALGQRRGRRVDVVCCCCLPTRIVCGGWTVTAERGWARAREYFLKWKKSCARQCSLRSRLKEVAGQGGCGKLECFAA